MARTAEQILSQQIGVMALQQAQILAQAEALAEERAKLAARINELETAASPPLKAVS